MFVPRKRDREMEVRIVMDSGGQRSYITDHASSVLSLPSKGRRPMSIVTFSSRKEKRHLCEIAMRTKEGPSQELLLFSAPLNCEPLANVPNRLCIENYEHLHQLDFADSLEDVGQGEPDILIGSDYYWQLITGEVIHGNGGPIAVCTRLGWDLSGPVSLKMERSASLVTHVLRVNTCRVLRGWITSCEPFGN